MDADIVKLLESRPPLGDYNFSRDVGAVLILHPRSLLQTKSYKTSAEKPRNYKKITFDSPDDVIVITPGGCPIFNVFSVGIKFTTQDQTAFVWWLNHDDDKEDNEIHRQLMAIHVLDSVDFARLQQLQREGTQRTTFFQRAPASILRVIGASFDPSILPPCINVFDTRFRDPEQGRPSTGYAAGQIDALRQEFQEKLDIAVEDIAEKERSRQYSQLCQESRHASSHERIDDRINLLVRRYDEEISQLESSLRCADLRRVFVLILVAFITATVCRFFSSH